MKKSFIERIFPHSPGDVLPQYDNNLPASSQTTPPSPPRILLRESLAASSHSADTSSALSTRRTTQPQPLAASSLVVRHDDPFLPVERAARALERTLQSLLDAQSEGLLAGVGAGDTNDTSSAGSLTPTPSTGIATAPKRQTRAKTIPVRQPQDRKLTLREARRGLVKSMAQFARLKDWELSLIDQEVAAREDALRQASNLKGQKKLLEDEIQSMNVENEAASLRSEAQKVEQEIDELEARLLEMKARYRQLVIRAREIESSRDSRLSSFTDSLRLNDNKVKAFLHNPPVSQSLGTARDPGMYALNPERRTLQMAEEQWTSEVEMLNARKADVEKEKQALEEGSGLWQDVVLRVRDFEENLRTQTMDLSQSQLRALDVGGDALSPGFGTTAEDASLRIVLDKLDALIAFLQEALTQAEVKNWNLLICSIGAELAAFEQARDLLQETAGLENSESAHPSGRGKGNLVDDGHEDAPHEDLLSGGLVEANGRGPRSPGESSNHSLEDTLREFGQGSERAKQNELDGGSTFMASRPELDTLNVSSGSRPRAGHGHTSESEDDEPGPEFLLSHT
ncbi:hypothetical protein A1O1_01252 [Capronia coronata CBS 617.96]|uniref:Autophagy-related protein 28 n=1 Tax=Capronia coronata CBS 617.96 TaxID=1182541 RepID=W9Z3G6_9EURO|nr:uncharacterized protein A1O1_01252 [Capronia coronata CBS 617.96]EXJ96126.1 hypothetical protein A1O1_01252 [Capronia coronata CBS 617.96]